MEPTTKKHSTTSLANTTLTTYKPQFSYRVALAKGAIVDVTSWASPAAEFGKSGVSVHVAVTARLWNRVVKTCVQMKYYEALYGKDRDVVQLAARALERAQRMGLDATNFHAYLATAGTDEDPEQTLRVEYLELDAAAYIVIGFPDEFASL